MIGVRETTLPIIQKTIKGRGDLLPPHTQKNCCKGCGSRGGQKAYPSPQEGSQKPLSESRLEGLKLHVFTAA